MLLRVDPTARRPGAPGRLGAVILVLDLTLALGACGTEKLTTSTTTPSTSTRLRTATSLPAPTTTSAVTAARADQAGLPLGPGPLPNYSVQSQPPPGSCHYRYVGALPLPDPHCTPGAINPRVTQASISSTICADGYTETIRPTESVTQPEKVHSAAAYGFMGSFRTAEYDHLIALELGGDPNDPANLWVEPNDDPKAITTQNSKDALEARLNHLVCSGRMALTAAQRAMASNWAAAYERYG